MAVINQCKRFIASATKLGSMPWNFKAHYRHETVKNLQTPTDLEKNFICNEDATALFKDYVEALYSGEIDDIADSLEPTFYVRTLKKVQEAHSEVA